MPPKMSDRIPCPKCYKWMPEDSLKNHWTHKKDHGKWDALLERQGGLQATEQQADITVQRGEFQGLAYGDNYDGVQGDRTGETLGYDKDVLEEDGDVVDFGEDVFGDGYNSSDNVSGPLHETMSGVETPERYLPTLQGQVEIFTGAGIS